MRRSTHVSAIILSGVLAWGSPVFAKKDESKRSGGGSDGFTLAGPATPDLGGSHASPGLHVGTGAGIDVLGSWLVKRNQSLLYHEPFSYGSTEAPEKKEWLPGGRKKSKDWKKYPDARQCPSGNHYSVPDQGETLTLLAIGASSVLAVCVRRNLA